MRICLISHSNCAKRQQDFGKVLSRYADVLMLCPTTWGTHKNESYREGNFELFCEEVQNAGDMQHYYFSNLSFQKVKEFAPDVIYQQNDVQCVQPKLSFEWAKLLRCRYVQFCWENIKKPTEEEKEFLKQCDLVIAGNDEAADFYGAQYILPQVGIEIKNFIPSDKKEIDVLFIGRMVPEKGVNHIREAYPLTVFLSDVPYEEVPKIMAKSKIFVSFPYDTPSWKEQWLSYCVVESLASGCIAIVSDSRSIKEYAIDSPVDIVPMKDVLKLREMIFYNLKNYDYLANKIEEGILFAKNFDNTVVAEKIFHSFKGLIL